MIYVLVANGFEETELIVPVDIMRRAGLPVQLVGTSGPDATGSHGITVSTDLALDDVVFYELDLLVIPGGQPGVDNLWADERVQRLVGMAAKMKKPIAAICAAPMIPGRLGLLEGKRAICYPGCEGDLKGATIVSDADTVRDGQFITARGPGAAFPFGLTIVETLCGHEKAAEIAQMMQYGR